MKEDKLALVKAVDSGDTDLGSFSHSWAIFITETGFSPSLPGPPPSTQAHALRFFLSLARRRGENPHTCWKTS